MYKALHSMLETIIVYEIGTCFPLLSNKCQINFHFLYTRFPIVAKSKVLFILQCNTVHYQYIDKYNYATENQCNALNLTSSYNIKLNFTAVKQSRRHRKTAIRARRLSAT